MIHTFAPALRQRVDWRVGEIRFRLWEEREAAEEKSREKYLIFYLDWNIETIIFVVPKVKRSPSWFNALEGNGSLKLWSKQPGEIWKSRQKNNLLVFWIEFTGLVFVKRIKNKFLQWRVW
jgi:hypothetical protein